MENIRIYTVHDLEPIDVNHCYRQVKGRPYLKFLSAEGKHFKEELKKNFIKDDNGLDKPEWKYFATEINLYIPKHKIYASRKGNVFEGRMSGWDASNYIKLIEDALFETYEVNDAYNLLISARKFLSGDDKFHIQIFVCESKLLQGIPNLE